MSGQINPAALARSPLWTRIALGDWSINCDNEMLYDLALCGSLNDLNDDAIDPLGLTAHAILKEPPTMPSEMQDDKGVVWQQVRQLLRDDPICCGRVNTGSIDAIAALAATPTPAPDERLREALNIAHTTLAVAYDRIHGLPQASDSELACRIGATRYVIEAALLLTAPGVSSSWNGGLNANRDRYEA